jgi:Nif-specific regulatory protein
MASAPPRVRDVSVLQLECDLYRGLLELGRQTSPASLLEEALALLVELTQASEGYVELHDEGEREDDPRWSVARGMSAERVREVRGAISRGIIAAAMASGETVVTADALLDGRFSERASVRRGTIRAVLCAPIGADPPRGTLYLVGGAGEKRFSEVDRARVELACHHLAPVVDRILQQHRLAAVADPTRPYRARLRLDGCVGRSQALADVLAEVAIAARSDRNALILGDTGSGKCQIARVIHDNSARSGRPFVRFNVTAVQDTLIEAELFGHERGAFTGAIGHRTGAIAQAEHGTLFLDEIGDISLKAQATLLHFLESKEYTPIGGSPVRADVRIIAGTNVDLEEAVAEGRFRRDLLYRLDVLTLRMPSLAERRSDIVELANAFRDEAARTERCAALPFSPATLRMLEAAPWPGNVRELEHAVQRGMNRAHEERVAQIEPRHLSNQEAKRQGRCDETLTFQESTQRFQKRLVEDALAKAQWNVQEAADALDISRSHLYNLMSAFGITRPPRS